jgi:hypothetical protein
MGLAVVDTNVAAVANAKDNHDPSCVTACVDYLLDLRANGTIVLDDAWLILGEYESNLRSSGQPGVGDAFFKWVLTNQANSDRCILTHITPNAERSFEEFPSDPALSDFDPSDRKFIAVARARPDNPPVAQALDSKWWGFRRAFKANGVNVEFLCPKAITVLHAGKLKGK